MFKTYISDQLSMSSKGNTCLYYGHIEGGVMHDIADWVLSDEAVPINIKDQG